jgi:WD40 repeat protein
MTDVFVSYSRRDIEIASRLCEALRNRGKAVFIDVGERLDRLVAAQAGVPAAETTATPTAAASAGVPEAAADESVAVVVTPAPAAAIESSAEVPQVVPLSEDAAAGTGPVTREHADERERAEIAGIPPSTLWMDEIRAAIAAADNVVVVISPDSCTSSVCQTELDYAVELGKRLIPVVVRDTPAELASPALRAINWLPVSAGPSFAADVNRLAEVLDTDVDGLHLHTRLTVRAREWDVGGHDKSLLLRGQELALAEKWLGTQAARKPAPTSVQTTYILASRAGATSRQRGFLIVGIALTVLMAGLTSVAGVEWRSAVVQREAAVQQSGIATSRALAAESGNELEADPQLALLLALRAYQSSPTTQAQTAVRQAAGASTVRGYLSMPHSAESVLCPSNTSGPGAFDRSGQYAVVTCAGYVEVWRWGSRLGPGSAARPYMVDVGGSPSGAIFNWAGNAVLFIGSGGHIYQWNWRTSSHAQSIGGPLENQVLFPTATGTLVASENGRTIAFTNLSSGLPSVIRVPCCSFAEVTLSPAITFSPNGAEVATLTIPQSSSQQGVVSVFDVSSGALIFSKTIPGAQLPIALSSDGQIAVTVGASAEVFSLAQPSQAPVVHDLASPPGLAAHCCDVDSPLAMTWTPNGDALAVGSEDTWMRVWLGKSSSPIYLDDSAATGAGGVAFSPNGQYLLTSGDDASQVWQWEADTLITLPSSGVVEGMAVSPNGQIFAAAESDNSILLWNWQTSQLRSLTIADSRVKSGTISQVLLAFSPNGDNLVSAGPDDYLRSWSMSDYEQTSEVRLPGSATSIAFSPSGSYFGVAYVGGVARWGTKGTPSPLIMVQPTNDGGLILSLSNTGAMEMLTLPDVRSSGLNGELIDSAAGSDRATPVAQSVPLPGAPGTTGTLLPDRKLILCSEICYMYAVGAHSVARLGAAAITDAAGFSLTADQSILYTTSLDGAVSAWDLKQSDQPVKVITAAGAAPGVQAGATANYMLLAYTSTYSTLELVPTVQDGIFTNVLGIARSEVVRSLTVAEREQYLGSGENG